ncbi:MAG: hypothetical protein A2W35_14500 [Chloroflexi bacterium RBG_16_57_11]|nr:MAG: hypothetical protein A2W35_14500 [Chloroflexi bacterium RBG_16_57_11]
MKRLPTELLFASLIILAALVLVFLTWANYRYSIQNPGGSDLLPRWAGTRLFIMEGQSPYSEETTQEIQRLFYGRPARSDEDQVLFVYPFYAIFLFSPFALIPDYNIARAVWMTVLEVSVILLVAAGLSLNRWSLSPFMLGVLLLFACLWYYTIRALINANAALLIALTVYLAFLAMRDGRDGLAGLLLALTTVKPQMVVLVILLVLIWSISNRRWILFWSFLGNLALFTAVTSLLIPNWIWQNLVQLFAYPDYTLPTTPGEIFAVWMPGVGMRLGYALTVILVATLIYEWRQAWGKDFRWLLWTAGLTLAATQLVGLPTATENYMIMFPALLMVFAAWDEQWRSLGKMLIFGSYILLFFGVWWLFLATLERGDQPVQGLIMFFPLPVFLLIGLYWVRWWVLRPEQPLLDRLRHSSRKQ